MNKAIATRRRVEIIEAYSKQIDSTDSEICNLARGLDEIIFDKSYIKGTTTLCEALAIAKLKRACDAFLDQYRSEIRQWQESGL